MPTLQSLTIDHFICFFMLLLTFVLGISSTGKVKGLEEYALSKGHKFSTPVISMTLIVTMIGSNASVGSISEIYNNGIIYACYLVAVLIGIFLLIQYASKFIIGRYTGSVSLYGIIEKEYGKWPAKFSSAVSVFISIIAISIQMIGMGYIAKNFLGISFYLGLAVTSVIFVMYSTVSGIRGVVYTDVLQFFIILVVFPILVGFVIYKTGDLDVILSAVPEEKFEIINHVNFIEYIFLSLFWIMPFAFLYPDLIQRFLMCNNEKQIKDIGKYWLSFQIFFMIMMLIIGFASISLVSNISSGKEVIPALMNEYFPKGIKGLAVTAFFAVIMSTADSGLNSATILVAEILMTEEEKWGQNQRKISPNKRKKDFEENGNIKQELNLKLYSFVLGGIAFLLALLDFSFVKGITIASAIAITAVNVPIFFAPFKKTEDKATGAYISSIVGGFGIFLILWIVLGQEKIYVASFFALIFAVIGWFIGTRYLDHLQTNFWQKIIKAYTPKFRSRTKFKV
jgi:SSS family solute:Na+ symporter